VQPAERRRKILVGQEGSARARRGVVWQQRPRHCSPKASSGCQRRPAAWSVRGGQTSLDDRRCRLSWSCLVHASTVRRCAAGRWEQGRGDQHRAPVHDGADAGHRDKRRQEPYVVRLRGHVVVVGRGVGRGAEVQTGGSVRRSMSNRFGSGQLGRDLRRARAVVVQAEAREKK
jgi:hypothetical protein